MNGNANSRIGTISSALSTDYYQLSMISSYLREGIAARKVVFDLFVRSLPGDWKYLIVCGIDETRQKIGRLHLDPQRIEYLRDVLKLDPILVDWLSRFRFTGKIRHVTEGTVVFAGEPIMTVEGTLAECQLIETLALATINYQTLIASKASRIVRAAAGRPVVDFGLRRAPGIEAGLRASRAAWIAGAVATSNVEAGFQCGIPVTGTHAHSFVLAHSSELEAFRAWCRQHPGGTTLLIDTYNIAKGAENAARCHREGHKVTGVRIDSGDLIEQSKLVRGILDAAGMQDTKIVVSNDLNEHKIAALVASKAPIDVFGVGTDMVTARPEAALGGVYKLVEIDGIPKAKTSSGKATYPGLKQIWRKRDVDVVGLAGESIQGEKLLGTIPKYGVSRPTLPEIRRKLEAVLPRLADGRKVEFSPSLQTRNAQAVAWAQAAQQEVDL